MLICDVTQFYSPFGGGVRRYLTEKRRFVETHTTDEHVLIVPGPRDGYEKNARLQTYTIASPLFSPTAGYRALLDQKKLAVLLKRIQPDLIETGDPYQVAWTALRTARTLRVPIVGFYHSHFPESCLRLLGRWNDRILRRFVLYWSSRYVKHLYSQLDCTLVCAASIRATLKTWGVSSVRPVKLGVDLTAFHLGPPDQTLRLRFGIPSNACLLLYVGRLAGEKNVGVLFDAFERLRRTSRRDVRLLCIGQGPWREQLLETRDRTHGAVTWLPHVGDSAQLAAFYRSADLAVHPSTNETFGLVPLEAQACGLPVCGIRGSALDENIMTGLQYWAPTNHASALANAIERMIAIDSSGWREKISHDVQNRFAWPVVLSDLWEVYRELVTENRAEWPGPRRRHTDSPPSTLPTHLPYSSLPV